MDVEYFNLSNGVACIGMRYGEMDDLEPRFSRLQSTWCEQKLWNQVLLTTPPDIYHALAVGHRVIVHDKSERDRLTRAQWQGLAMIRVACNVAWWGTTGEQFSRSGMNTTAYFVEEWFKLPETTRRYIEWFGKYAPKVPSFWVDLRPCEDWIPAEKQPRLDI